MIKVIHSSWPYKSPLIISLQLQLLDLQENKVVGLIRSNEDMDVGVELIGLQLIVMGLLQQCDGFADEDKVNAYAYRNVTIAKTTTTYA